MLLVALHYDHFVVRQLAIVESSGHLGVLPLLEARVAPYLRLRLAAVGRQRGRIATEFHRLHYHRVCAVSCLQLIVCLEDFIQRFLILLT